jgi:predicted acylesterase/phospholipase RssA
VRALAPRVPSFACGSSEVAALGRRWSGRSVGLVLSGGGARALAHLGVLDELHACGVNVDRIAGAGTGALIGAMAAAGWSAAEVDGACYEELVRRRPFGGYRVGRTSLIRGEPVARMLERLFGEAWIEELPLQFACTSADLVTGERVVHRSGPVAQAVLAAITTPGLMAPVAVGERLLVDAGMLDNLPVDLLDRREGPIVAVDVAPRERGPARVERSRPPSRRDRDAVALPAIGEALARAMVLGSCAAAESARRNVDYSIVPDTGGVGMLEYHQLDELRAAGRRAARAALAS